MIEEIKNRINIKHLVSELGIEIYKNDFIYSIYKVETTPSLKLYPATNSYFCFATGQGGDVINFYADYKRIGLKKAVKELAVRAGLDYKENKKIKVKSKKIIERKRIEQQVTILKSEVEFFEERAGVYEYMMELDRCRAEIRAMDDLMNERKEKQNLIYESLEKYCYGIDDDTFDYLRGKDRGLSQETIKRFRLFSIKDLKLTIEYLRDCFSEDELIIAGLINKNGKLVFTYHKLIIPYLENNKICYLRGRRIQSSTEMSKYISLSNFGGNLPLKRFFNIDTLKRVKENERLIVCEGEFDTMIMEQEGYAAIGIPGVTNIPADQIGTIKKYDLYIAFDNDEAGELAMHKITNLLNRPVKAIKLNHNNDITELINERRNRENI
ncbi:MAG: toprim domain-containing protein [Ignavibacteriales bacterium]|nr:toprim domain-containing protein [Ignavibacteriales bacterium]